MRHGERIKHIHASGDPTADRHFADAEKRGAFAEVNGVFEVHAIRFVSTGRRFQFRHFVGIDSSCSLVVWLVATLAFNLFRLMSRIAFSS
jgi:hypothetical protein